MAALGDESVFVRANAARSLGKLGDRRAVDELIALVEREAATLSVDDGRGSLKRKPWSPAYNASIEALAELGGPRAAEVVAKLLEAATHEDDRKRLVQALGKIGHADSTSALIGLIKGADPVLTPAAIDALREIRSVEAVEPLIEALSSDSYRIRDVAARTLGKIGDPRAFEPLEALLSDEEFKVRKASVWGMRDIEHPRRAEVLMAVAWGADSELAKAGIAALRELKESGLEEPLGRYYDSGDAKRRWAIMKILGAFDSPEAVELLKRGLGAEDPTVRERAAWSMEDRPDDKSVVLPLVAALQDPAYMVRRAAVWGLSEYDDPRALAALVMATRDIDSNVRWGAAEGLGTIGDSTAAPALVKLLGDDNDHVRWAASLSLAVLADPATLTPLVARLKDSKYFVRAAAAFALTGFDEDEARAALREETRGMRLSSYVRRYSGYISLGNEDDVVFLAIALGREGDMEMAKAFYWSNLNAVKQLARCWARKKGVLAELDASQDSPAYAKWYKPRESLIDRRVAQLSDPEVGARAFAARSLGNAFDLYAPREGAPMFAKGHVIVIAQISNPMEPPTPEDESVPGLDTLDRVTDAMDFFRVESRNQYTPAQMKRAVSAVAAALDDPEVKVRASAAYALGATHDPIAVEPLSHALEDEDEGVRLKAVSALNRIRTDEAALVLARALNDPSPKIRRTAVFCLGYQGRAVSFSHLVRVANDPDARIRTAAFEGLMHIGDERGIPLMVNALGDEDEKVRVAAIDGLAVLGGDEEVEPLSRMLGDSNGAVIAKATVALVQIGTDNARKALVDSCEGVDVKELSEGYREEIVRGDERMILPLIVSMVTYGDAEMRADLYWCGNKQFKDAVEAYLFLYVESFKSENRNGPQRPKWGCQAD